MRSFVVLCSLIFATILVLNGCDGKDSANTSGRVVVKDGNSLNSSDDNGSKDKGDNSSDNNNSKDSSDDSKKSDNVKKDNDSKDKGDNDKKESNNTIKRLTLSIEKTNLNKDHNTTINIEAKYDDNTTKRANKIEWLIIPKDAVVIKGNTLTALKDTNVTIQAKVGNILSNRVKVNIYWEVDGYRLPPEPDPIVNNATLGGVDSNNNGIRDDVEWWIYKRYPVKLQRELMMDGARVFQKTLIAPISEAKQIAKDDTKVIDCELFLGDIDKTIGSDKWIEEGERLKNIIFNTKERVRKYLDYNLALSGGVYGSSPSDWNKDACSQGVRKVLEEMGL